ncbi:MAG: hypothetical protein ACR2J9_09485, partial [Gaiellales bacterium]
MKLSRTRLILSGALGLSLAVTALTVASMLNPQADPALAQSTTLRQQFTTPVGTTNSVDSLRPTTPADHVQDVELAAPAPAPTPAADTA